MGDTPIPLPTIDAKILNVVVKWYEYQAEYHSYLSKKDAIAKWKTDFIYRNEEILFDVIHAAEDLEIPDLLDCIFRMAADMISSGFWENLDCLSDKDKVGIAQYLLPYAYLAASGAGVVPTTRDLKHRAKIWTSVFKSDTLFKSAISLDANPIIIGRSLIKFKGAQYLAMALLDQTDNIVYGLPKKTRLLDLFHPGELKNEELSLNGADICINISELIKRFVRIDSRIDIPEPDSSTVKHFKQLYKEEDGRVEFHRVDLIGPPTIVKLGCRQLQNFRSAWIPTESRS